MNVIEARDLRVTFSGQAALEGVTFSIAAGDYVGIIGPNGSGKTTLVRSMLGLIEPDAGEIKLFGYPSAAFAQRSKIGFLPQKGLFLDPRFPAMVEEIVASGILSKKPYPKKLGADDRAAINNAISLLGIEDIRRKPIGKLSGGQQQRMLLARALAGGPELLILDEPTVALDPQSRERFYETLKELNSARHMTIVLVTHDLHSVCQYASRVMFLDRRVAFYGNREEFHASDYGHTHASH